MKIVQILPELNAGGVERGTLELADHLVRHGHEAIVVSNGGRLVPELEKSGARHVAMAVHRKSLATLLQVGRMRKFLVETKPDILHLRSRVPGWVAWLAWRGMDPATRPRLVSTVHGFYSVNRYSAVMTRGERVIAVSESIRDYILTHYPQTRPEVIRVIPRGIRPGDFGSGFRPAGDWLEQWEAEQPGLGGREILLLPGRITRLKGHEDFFRLVSALRSEGRRVVGLVVGDTHPKKRAYLQELTEKAGNYGGSDAIRFLGHRSDVREIMAVSDVVCALSQQPESFGRTVLEALALGKPVVGYDCGGVGELLAEFFPAGRVPLGEVGGLIGAARTILKNRPLPAPVGEPYTLEAMCSTTTEVYEELLASPR